MRKNFISLIVVFLLAATAAFAGTQMAFKCGRCSLAGEYGTGGGFNFEEISCFCTKKHHFVSVTWKRGAPMPKPVRREGTVAVYRCPQCKTATARQWNQKSCPRCGNRHISVKPTGMIYD